MRYAFAALLVTVTISGAPASFSDGARGFSASARKTDERAAADAPKRVARKGRQPSEPARLKGSPSFAVDPFWPKPLPNHWLVGAVAGVAVDAKDHVWITHRPSTLQPNELRSIWKAAPPVLEFDQDGTLLSAWGGPGPGYEWPQREPGIYTDARGHEWLG